MHNMTLICSTLRIAKETHTTCATWSRIHNLKQCTHLYAAHLRVVFSSPFQSWQIKKYHACDTFAKQQRLPSLALYLSRVMMTFDADSFQGQLSGHGKATSQKREERSKVDFYGFFCRQGSTRSKGHKTWSGKWKWHFSGRSVTLSGKDYLDKERALPTLPKPQLPYHSTMLQVWINPTKTPASISFNRATSLKWSHKKPPKNHFLYNSTMLKAYESIKPPTSIFILTCSLFLVVWIRAKFDIKFKL